MDICLHMEGGVDFNTAWGMSFSDRELAIKMINKKNKNANPNAPEYL
jgi:hypothetical protein